MAARIWSVALALSLGALAMTVAQAPGQEKKKSASKMESYDEKVTVKRWDGKQFTKPVDNVLMFRGTDKDGVIRFWTWPAQADTGNPTKGSELTDKDGVVWLVEKTDKLTFAYVSTVKKKPVEKKE